MGFATSIQNLALVIFPMIVAFIYSTSNSYETVNIFLYLKHY